VAGRRLPCPYERAILLPVFFVAAIHPPRRIAGFLAFVGLALCVPFVYDGWVWSPAEGDRCLRKVAGTLSSSVRDPDRIFRWGGDEFALILKSTSAQETGSLRNRLALIISSACVRPDDNPIEIRFAVAEVDAQVSADEVVEMVGLALTAAKGGVTP
jgi:hypothetical protein